MKLLPEVNAARRNNLWKEFGRTYPKVHSCGYIQAFLAELGLPWEKDSEHFYLKKSCFAQEYYNSIIIKIKSLEVIVNVSLATTNLSEALISEGQVPSMGYIYSASNVYKPFSLTDMRRILRQNTTTVR